MTISIQFDPTNPIARNGDVVTVAFADGSSRDFESVAGFQQWVAQSLENIGQDGLKAIACCHLLTTDPLMDSPQLWSGKTFTLDPEQPVFANVLKKV